MRKFLIFGAAAIALAASAVIASVPDADGWVIGPIIKGRNYSPGMPLHPSEVRDGLFQIELPQAPGSVHYVTFPHGSLEGKRRIVLRYRLETAQGARIVATTDPTTPGIITPYFQRAGDNWSGRGRFESYRWYQRRSITKNAIQQTKPPSRIVPASDSGRPATWTLSFSFRA